MAQSNGEIEQMIMTRFGMDLTEDWYDSFRYEDRVMLRDWIIADRKQHELEARIKERQEARNIVHRHSSHECHEIDVLLDKRLAELKAEREMLDK